MLCGVYEEAVISSNFEEKHMRLTKRFMDWYRGNNDKEKETPKGGVKRVGYVLWNYAGRLVGANVLFLCAVFQS